MITRRTRLDVRDGINIVTFDLANALIEAGHVVTVPATQIGDPARISELFAMRAQPTLAAVGADGSYLSLLERGAA